MAAGGTKPARSNPCMCRVDSHCASCMSVLRPGAFTNGRQSSVKLALSDAREPSVPQAASGSGARYANSNESFVFWNKGNTAFIEENGRTTYSGCTTKR
jgi:membrane-bound inhibitor of C-type lysozyme